MIDLTTILDRKSFVEPIAKKYLLDSVLVCALIEHESSWNPYTVRFEPAFYRKYVYPATLKPNGPGITEAYTRAISWGLMQVMGETAREFGYAGIYLSELCEPDVGTDYGCKKLRRCFDVHLGKEDAALLAYNGGSDLNYATVVQSLKPKYY